MSAGTVQEHQGRLAPIARVKVPGTHAADVEVALRERNALEVTPNRWLINGEDFITLRKVKEATGSAKYVLESDLTRDATYRLFGIPVTITHDKGVASKIVYKNMPPKKKTDAPKKDNEKKDNEAK